MKLLANAGNGGVGIKVGGVWGDLNQICQIVMHQYERRLNCSVYSRCSKVEKSAPKSHDKDLTGHPLRQDIT